MFTPSVGRRTRDMGKGSAGWAGWSWGRGAGGGGEPGIDEGCSVSYSSSCRPELWLHEYIHFPTICGMFSSKYSKVILT